MESEFGVTLPADYVRFMRDYPKLLDDTKCKFGAESEEAISARYFLKSADAVLEENRMIRRALAGEGPAKWPQSFFAIGANDIGDIYAIDCDAGGSAVTCWNHEEDVFEPVAESVVKFADHLVVEVLEWNRINFPDEKPA
jgi:hypothetical protein